MTSAEASSLPPTLPDWASIWESTLGWMPTSSQQQQFQALYAQILEGNRQLNLTRITEPVEFSEKHLWDSLRGIQDLLSPPLAAPSPAPESPKSSSPFSAIDIGTGAGFPGIPIAIVQPEWTVTLLDSTRKKITFLEQMLKTLELPNVKTLVGRVEEVGQQRYYRAQYDLALIRAVSGASVGAEYTLPLLRVGGLAVLYRGQWTEAEAEALERATDLLGGKIEAIAAFKTPISQSDRHCIYLRKVKQTPAPYPRLIGIPEQKPLGIAKIETD
ncbi:MAG: 16S rRNA (guanine(527)-N(7))-methyltransferase RsmG [Leptolyngbyaceae cyanobacterium bins.302]|nr:16S rRNA (guanine(527)-N(7))-methyltransferase RsmG [Leptolyngbyaceae cyanobacterium bins.302]